MTYAPGWSEQSFYAYQGVPIPHSVMHMAGGPLARVACVPVKDNILVVDLRNGSVHKLLPEPQPVRALQVTRYGDRQEKGAQLLLQTDQSILVFSDELQPLAEYRLPADDHRGSLSLLRARDGSTWAVAYSDPVPQVGSDVELLHWTANGQPPTSQRIELKNSSALGQDSWFSAVSLAVPSPITLTATVFGFAPYAMWSTERVSWSAAVARCFAAGAAPALAIVWLLGLGAAFLAYRHARSEAMSPRETIIWSVFVLLLGPAACLGYRFHRRWPRRLPCPAGGHSLPADHFDCPTCHAVWPLPAMKGIEVLEPAEA